MFEWNKKFSRLSYASTQKNIHKDSGYRKLAARWILKVMTDEKKSESSHNLSAVGKATLT